MRLRQDKQVMGKISAPFKGTISPVKATKPVRHKLRRIRAPIRIPIQVERLRERILLARSSQWFRCLLCVRLHDVFLIEQLRCGTLLCCRLFLRLCRRSRRPALRCRLFFLVLHRLRSRTMLPHHLLRFFLLYRRCHSVSGRIRPVRSDRTQCDV